MSDVESKRISSDHCRKGFSESEKFDSGFEQIFDNSVVFIFEFCNSAMTALDA